MIKFWLLLFCFWIYALSNYAHAKSVQLDLSGDLVLHTIANKTAVVAKTTTSAALVESLSAQPKIVIPSTNVSVPTSHGVKSLPLKNISLDVATNSRLGRAALNLGRRVSPIGLGLAVTEMFCALVSICPWDETPAGESDGQTFAKKTVVDNGTWKHAAAPTEYGSPIQACNAFFALYGDLVTSRVEPQGPDAYRCMVDPYTDPQAYATRASTDVTETFVQPTESDWDSAYAFFELNNVSLANRNIMAHTIVEKKEPLPVEDAQFVPQVFIIDSKVDTIRDGQGIATGYEESETKIKLTPQAGNTVGVEEETIVTSRDAAGVTTGTKTTTDKPPSETDTPEEPPKLPTIEIDNTPDIDLPTYAAPSTLSTTSWGDGSCPSNPSVSLHGLGSLTIPLQPVCNSMSMIRPIIILLAFLAAAYIVMGARKND